MTNGVLNQTLALNETLLKVADLLFRASRELAILTQRLARDSSQAWFWSKNWQAKEKTAKEDFAAGRFKTYEDVEELIGDLKKTSRASQAK